MQDMLKDLDKIVPVVVRVHSDHHPELKEVGQLYPQLRQALDEGNDAKKAEVMAALSEVTKAFEVPSDACPTYTKVYQYLDKIGKM